MDKSQTLHWKVITVYIVKPLSGRPLKNTLDKSEICERLTTVYQSESDSYCKTIISVWVDGWLSSDYKANLSPAKLSYRRLLLDRAELCNTMWIHAIHGVKTYARDRLVECDSLHGAIVFNLMHEITGQVYIRWPNVMREILSSGSDTTDSNSKDLIYSVSWSVVYIVWKSCIQQLQPSWWHILTQKGSKEDV